MGPFCLPLALLVLAVPSWAQAPPTPEPKYYPTYEYYVNKSKFWRNVSEMGNKPVSDGLGIWNESGKFGPGIVSESMGYAMMLAALYNDKQTFDRLSKTIQAGINSTGLFPWYWKQMGSNHTVYAVADENSASDGDINIALAYVYADTAKQVYGWNDSSPTLTYKMMAQNYIAAIRLNDFSTNDSLANNHVLADGYRQASSKFASNNWHPDYSDIRAYQLFKTYDTANGAFWSSAISYTMSCWKAIFNFGSNDPRTMENPHTGPISSENSWVKLSNSTYQNLQANSAYSAVSASRGGMEPTLYTSDSQRLPMRLLNYVNAEQNSKDVDMIGIASANLTALGTSYSNALYEFLVDKEPIAYPWKQETPGWIQDFTAAGLLAYASYYSKLDNPAYSNGMSVDSSLDTRFGTNGMNGSIAVKTDLDGDDCFNASLTLWGLSVSRGGMTPLQAYMLTVTVN
jgi:Glycosyl hydrolases family 8